MRCLLGIFVLFCYEGVFVCVLFTLLKCLKGKVYEGPLMGIKKFMKFRKFPNITISKSRMYGKYKEFIIKIWCVLRRQIVYRKWINLVKEKVKQHVGNGKLKNEEHKQRYALKIKDESFEVLFQESSSNFAVEKFAVNRNRLPIWFMRFCCF